MRHALLGLASYPRAATPICRSLHFNIAQTDGFYSILTGLLAGFAFTTLILLTINRLERAGGDASQGLDRGRFANAQQVLAAAFIGLVLMSLAYAAAAGETTSSGRSASEEPILGVGFALSGLLVIYSIVLTLDAVYSYAPSRLAAIQQFDRESASESEALMRSGSAAALFLRDTLGRLVTLIAVLYVYLGVSDYESIRYFNDRSRIHALDVLITALIIIQLTCSAFFYPSWTRKARSKGASAAGQKDAVRASYSAPRRSDRAAPLLSKVSVFITFLCAIWFAVYDNRGNLCSTVTPLIPAAGFLIVGFAVLLFTYQLAYSRPDPLERVGVGDRLHYLKQLGAQAGTSIRVMTGWLNSPREPDESGDEETAAGPDAERTADAVSDSQLPG